MKKSFKRLIVGLLIWPCSAFSANQPAISGTGSVVKMLLGLAVVLAVMALIAWSLKRVLPAMGANRNAVARVVGGVSVGTRERVVVVEIADRWIVVGVAAGQVTSLANMSKGESTQIENAVDKSQYTGFSEWLQSASTKLVNAAKPNNTPEEQKNAG